MIRSLARGLTTLGLATVCSLLDMKAEQEKVAPVLTQPRRKVQEGLENILKFSFSSNQKIKGIQIHHIRGHDFEYDKNGYIVVAPDRLECIYANSAFDYTLVVPEPIPAKGILAVFVPQDLYWGSTIDLRSTESLNGGPVSSVLYTNVVNLTNVKGTEKDIGKPQSVVLVTMEKRKSSYEKHFGKPLTEKRTYNLSVFGSNGMMHSCMFTVDYGSTNEVNLLQKTNVLRAPQESK